MSKKQENKKRGGLRKIGRNRHNKRPFNQEMSAYVRGSISFEEYAKRTGVKFSSKN